MNRSELRLLVREYLNEPTEAFWTDANLNGYINIACPIIHNRIKNVSRYHFTTRATFPTAAGTGYYQLPADCKDVKMITRIDTGGKEIPLMLAQWPDPTVWTPDRMLDPNNGSSDEGPAVYWIVGQSLRLLPVPQSVVTLRLYYEARITSLAADADIPSFDADYHDMAAKWAAIEAAVKDNKDLSALKDLFKARGEDLIQDVLHRIPAPEQVVESYMEQ